MEAPGLIMQMDGSPHRWFGNKKHCLITMIDDATSEVNAEFFPSETTVRCLKVMRDCIETKGVFKTLYVDRAAIFGGPKRCNFSQMQRACEELGIEIIFANSPQGKGRVERAFDTFQDRLVPELRLKEIKDLASANAYLKHVFIPRCWQTQIQVKSKHQVSEFTPLSKHTNLDDICVIKEHRKIRNDHTFSYGNKFYLIDSPLKHSIANQKIEIRNTSKKGFMRLRYYGFMVNSIRRKSLTLIRKSLGKEVEKLEEVITDTVQDKIGSECPSCHYTGMVLIGIILPNKQLSPFQTI